MIRDVHGLSRTRRAFTLLELLVIFLQAYIFVILTTVYIQLAVAEEH
jgi:F-type H+-transporting ATPase subunit a